MEYSTSSQLAVLVVLMNAVTISCDIKACREIRLNLCERHEGVDDHCLEATMTRLRCWLIWHVCERKRVLNWSGWSSKTA
jgi:hypothetical protein